MKIVIKNCQVVPITQDNLILFDTNIGIVDDRISFLGEIPADFVADKIIDGTKQVALPGLINAHTHIAMSLLRNYADDLPFWEWLFHQIIPIETKMNESDVYWGSMLSLAEMIQSGTTCLNDMYFRMDQVGKAIKETGMRAVLGRGITGDFEKDKSLFDTTHEMYENWHKKADGRITTMVAPHAIYSCSEATLQQAVMLAEKWNTGIHIHVSESQKEMKKALEKYNITPIQFLRELGLFDVHTAAAHCIQVTMDDVEILKKNNVHVLHNPSSGLKLANGIMPLSSMQKRKINIAIGTDSPASNNNQNMIEEMHLASLIHKGIEQNSTVAPAYEILKMATINGAKALKLEDEIGSLELGKKADIILLDTDKPHWIPHHNFISALVYSAQAADIETVIIDGRIMMENRNLQTIDLSIVKKEISKCEKRLWER